MESRNGLSVGVGDTFATYANNVNITDTDRWAQNGNIGLSKDEKWIKKTCLYIFLKIIFLLVVFILFESIFLFVFVSVDM